MSEPRQLTNTVKIRLLEHIISATERGPDTPTWEHVREIALQVAEIAVRLSNAEAEDRGRKAEREQNDGIFQTRLDELSKSTDKGVNYRRMELKKLRRRIEGGQT